MINVLVVLLALIQSIPPKDLPKPPDGFSWQKVPEIKAAFLKPTGWFFKEERVTGSLALFITKENIGENGQFQTGLTVNVFHLKKDSAIDRGRALIENLATNHGGKALQQTFGPFQEFSSLVTISGSTPQTKMYALTVANPKTNTLYMFIFESPESEWESAWKIGKPIIDELALDDEL
jgi:hypothetical protein